MKRILFALGLLAAIVFAAAAYPGKDAKGGEGHAQHAMAKAQYMVIAPHTEAECMQTLDDVSAMGASSLAKWQFGCMDGDHTGYCIVSASSAEEALKNVPPSIRAKARAVKMHRFTAAELKSIHEKMKG